jgi:hypothetical protein
MLVVAALVGGCSTQTGQATTTASESAPVDPCQLLDPADVEAMLGEPVEAFNPFFSPFIVTGMRFCSLKTSNATIQVGVASIYARDVYEQHNEKPQNATFQPVPGFGDEAVRENREDTDGISGSNRILVLQGEHVLGVSLNFKPVPYQDVRLDRATTKLLQRLSS